jgi:uncharacterized protein YbaP (TraB family)
MTTRQASQKLVIAVALAISIASVRIESAANNFLWKATKGQGSLYLVGSVHLLTKDYYPLSPALERAFKDSDLLVEEVDIGQMIASENQLQMLTTGMLPAGQSLDKVVSPGTLAAVNKRLETLGMPIEPHKHFYNQARRDAMTVQGLETVTFQISLFDGMTMEEQDRLLAETLKELDTQLTAMKTLADAWKAGDAPTVERLVLQDLRSEPRIYQRMLVDRNRDWLPKVEALFARRGRAFVVVGAAHLIGPDGLLAMLRARGYTVEQM